MNHLPEDSQTAKDQQAVKTCAIHRDRGSRTQMTGEKKICNSFFDHILMATVPTFQFPFHDLGLQK